MLGIRLKEERERLGFTQPQLGAIAGTKKGTVINWEKGASSPTGTQFEEMAKVGVDVTYVITGEHNQAALPPSLSADQQMLLEAYQALPVAQQKALLASLLTAEVPKPKTKKSAAGTNSGSLSIKGKNSNVQIVGRDYNEG